MASCFQPPKMSNNKEDSMFFFSASNSPDEEYSSSSSSSSRSHHSPKQTCKYYPKLSGHYRLTVMSLSYTLHKSSSSLFSRFLCKPKPINILKSVSFMAESSEILAVVGPSGTGKSTLLKVISGRVKEREFDPETTILINDQKITNPSHLRKLCGFVPQEDDLLPMLTVHETLTYSASFKLKEATAKERQKRVETLLQDLRLVHVRDTFIGEGDEDNRGISGGERKRVSIAVEMIRDPPILLLDEPTSGLDSRNSLLVIDLLASMAKSKRRTIVISIHQPSYRILRFISNFLILSRGSVVHHGSLESLEESIARLGFQIPAQLNPLEFAMEIMDAMENSNLRAITTNTGARTTTDIQPIWSPEIERRRPRRLLGFSEIMNLLENLNYGTASNQTAGAADSAAVEPIERRRSHHPLCLSEITNSPENSNQGTSAPDVEPIGPPRTISRRRSHNCLLHVSEIAILCSRFWKIIYRTKQLFLARTMQALVGGFGLGSVYVGVRRDDAGVAERLGLFAFSLSFLLSSTVEALPIFLSERRVLMKEASRGNYRTSSYLIANTITFLPFLFVVSVLFSVPVYWIVGLNPSFYAFGFFVFVVWLIVMMASSLVMFLSAVAPDFISGNSLICTVLGAFFLFSGYFIPKENIPKYWVFMYYISLYRYPLDSMLVNEYWSMRGECFSWHLQEGNSSPSSPSRCLVTGDDVLKGRGLNTDTRWVNVGIMLGFFVFYRVLCWAILARKASRSTV